MKKSVGVLIAGIVLLLSATLTVSAHRKPLISLPDLRVKNQLSLFQSSLNQDIVIEKADSHVSASDLHDIIFILQKYSIPTLNADISHSVKTALYIRLFDNKQKFQSAVKKYFPTASDTGGGIVLDGFANGTTAYIPMYKYKTVQNRVAHYANSELSNYLTHELTHAILNANNVSIPIWVNEGFAWYNGMNAETRFNASRSIQLSNSNYYNLDYAAQTTGIVPLGQSEGEIFKETKYNLEFEDFAAVSELISDYGLKSFRQFVFATSHESSALAYQQTYHSSLGAYEHFFYEYTGSN